jgi:serine protease Do
MERRESGEKTNSFFQRGDLMMILCVQRKLSSGGSIGKIAMFLACLLSIVAWAESAIPEKKSDMVHEMDKAFQDLAKRVSPAVVEVQVTGYGSSDEDSQQTSSPVGRERSLGAGIIVEPDGYIITNYHVIKGADRVRVVLTPPPSQEPQALALVKSHGRVLPARVIGFSKQIDLAVLKVEATGLPTIPIGRYEQLQKGQIALAFGSPEGLENSVSFGLVSSVLRQPDPDSPMVYIQTDAAINPGNSGGPLMDLEGNMVGINTFIYTKSGGNEGIGFAIPAGIVRYAYEEIRKYGRVRRRTIGAYLQTLTTDMAEGLGLSVEDGVIVSDVPPRSTAERAGLKIQDVIVSVDGMPVDNVALFALSLYAQDATNFVKVHVLRGGKYLELNVPFYESRNEPDQLSDLADPTKDLIPRLGILGLTVTAEVTALMGELRIPSGVAVASIVDDRLAVDSGLVQGDVIHSLKGKPITSVDELRAAFNQLKPGEAATMQVERNGRLTYVSFMME